MKIYYFGCWDEPGHYLRDPSGRSAYREYTPWGRSPDGTLAPEGQQVQGLALLHKKNGWTAIGFWDRTLDHRLNSNSAFLAEGDFTFEQMLELANEHFPTIMKRIGNVRQKL